ncbi:MAG: amidohydrolase family protein, partial [Candidatus Dormibacteraeota bacterium]|nr:amidohydrolase family protein [Candidatus Dormibacteraeota bacterium]
MNVDAHVHILAASLRDRRDEIAAGDAWFAMCHTAQRAIATADELFSEMERAEIDHAVCLGWPFADRALREASNEHLAALQQQHPQRITAFGIVNPASADTEAELRRCAERGLRGIGELNCDAQQFSLEDDRVAAAATLSVELGLIWNLHCSEPVGHDYAGKGTTTPDRVARFAIRNASLQLICAHLGGGLPFFAHMQEVAQLCRRLWFDTAAVPFLYEPS